MPKQSVSNETEKITINATVMDLGHIDLLVEDGYYSNRADFIRTAVRDQLAKHAEHLRGTIDRRMMAMGIVRWNRKFLENEAKRGRRLEGRVVGMLSIDKEVSPQLARQAIKCVEVRGVLRASEPVKSALADRIH